MIFTVAFWKGAGERALKTFLQTFIPTFLAALGVTASGQLDAWTAPWLAALESAAGLALGAAFLSLCTSLGNAGFTAGSVVPQTPLDPSTPAPAPDVSTVALPYPIDTDAPAGTDEHADTPEQPDPAGPATPVTTGS